MSSIPPPNGIFDLDQDRDGFDITSLLPSAYPLDLDGQSSQEQSRLSQPEAGPYRSPPFPLRDLPWVLQQPLTLPVNDPRLMRLAESSRQVNMPANYRGYTPHQYLGSGEVSRGLSHSTHNQYRGGTQSSLSGSEGMHGQAVSFAPPWSPTVASTSEPSPAPSRTRWDGVNSHILPEAPVLSTVHAQQLDGAQQLDPAQTHMTHAGQLWIKDTVFRDLAKFLTTMNIEIPLTTPEDDECSICRLEYGRERVGVKTVCGHWFCGACILEWFGMPRYSCPMCRGNLKKPPRRPARERRRGRAA